MMSPGVEADSNLMFSACSSVAYSKFLVEIREFSVECFQLFLVWYLGL